MYLQNMTIKINSNDDIFLKKERGETKCAPSANFHAENTPLMYKKKDKNPAPPPFDEGRK